MSSVTPFRSEPAETLESLAAALASCIEAESALHAERIKTEQKILALAGELPAEGTTRLDAGDWQVVVKTAMNRKVDADKLTAIAARIPEAIGQRLIRWKPELVTREVRYIENNEPELYGVLGEAMTLTPAKPSVKLEPAKQAA